MICWIPSQLWIRQMACSALLSSLIAFSPAAIALNVGHLQSASSFVYRSFSIVAYVHCSQKVRTGTELAVASWTMQSHADRPKLQRACYCYHIPIGVTSLVRYEPMDGRRCCCSKRQHLIEPATAFVIMYLTRERKITNYVINTVCEGHICRVSR